MVDGLKEQIIDDRELSPDKSSVTYKLADNHDFSRSREFTRILADIFFEKDYSLKKKKTVRSKKTMKDFEKGLKDEMFKNFYRELQFSSILSPFNLDMRTSSFFLLSKWNPLHLQKLLDEVMINTTIRYI